MDKTFFHIDFLLKLYCLFEKTDNKQKRGGGWSIFQKTYSSWLVHIAIDFIVYMNE